MLFYRMGAIDRVDQLAGTKTVRFKSKRWTMAIGTYLPSNCVSK